MDLRRERRARRGAGSSSSSSANRSATTRDPARAAAYPPDFTIPTALGRPDVPHGRPLVGSRSTSGPIPRSTSTTRRARSWPTSTSATSTGPCPGRPNGTLTEKTCFAITELIRREKVDIAIDFHEAELQYPVISTIVAHQKGADLAAAASMFISSIEGFSIGVENSPKALRGLSHREIGDATGRHVAPPRSAGAFPRRDAGPDGPRAPAHGQDEFVVRAGKRGLLFEKIDEKGWPIDVRVGRHTSTILQLLEIWSGDHPDKAVAVSGVPRYTEVIEKGTGAFLKDPKSVDPSKLYFE